MNVHGKVMIVDDRCARVGSANLSNRSMGLDTECDLVLDADLGPAPRAHHRRAAQPPARRAPGLRPAGGRRRARRARLADRRRRGAARARALPGAVAAAPGDRRGRRRRGRRGHREAAGPTSLSSTASPAIPSARPPISCSRCWSPRACARPVRRSLVGWATGDRGRGRAGRRLAADAAAHAARRGSGGRPRPRAAPIIRRRRSPCWRPTWSGRWCSSRSRCCSARPRCCSPPPPRSSIAWSARCPRRSRPTASAGWSDAFARAGCERPRLLRVRPAAAPPRHRSR